MGDRESLADIASKIRIVPTNPEEMENDVRREGWKKLPPRKRKQDSPAKAPAE